MERRRVLKWTFLGLGILTSPLLALSSLILINSINPMQLMFLYTFDVTNQSEETLWITPVGTVGRRGDRHVLPQFINEFPAFDAIREGGYRLGPGKTRQIIYDWDDINFSEIAIMNEPGQWRQLVVDANPTEGQYRPPREDSYVIESFQSLSPIDERVLTAATTEKYNLRALLLGAAGIVPIAMFVLALTLGRAAPERSTWPDAAASKVWTSQRAGGVKKRISSTGRIVACVIAAILIATTLYFTTEWYRLGRDLDECADARPVSVAVDFSRPGTIRAPFKQAYTLPDGEAFYLAMPFDIPVARALELLRGLDGTITITDSEGNEILVKTISPEAPETTAAGPILLADFVPFAKGDYTVTIDITTGAPALAGTQQTLFAKYEMCGFEPMPVMLAAFLAILCAVPAVVLTAFLTVGFVRRGIRRSRRAVSA
jgi:hypothetical protein